MITTQGSLNKIIKYCFTAMFVDDIYMKIVKLGCKKNGTSGI